MSTNDIVFTSHYTYIFTFSETTQTSQTLSDCVNKQTLASVALTATRNSKSRKLTSGIFPHANIRRSGKWARTTDLSVSRSMPLA